MKAEKFNQLLLNMMNSPSSAADVWTRKQPETDTENKESVGDVNLPPVHTYDELKKMRRNAYIKMVAIVGIIVTALAFGSVAWFTESREVEGSGVQMTSSDLPFEIQTVGSVIPNNGIITALGYKDGKTITGGATTQNVGDIKWMLAPTDTMAGDGLRPGTEGSLHFTIVPSQRNNTKNLQVSYSLKITGYKLSDDMKERIAAENTKKLNGQTYTMPTVTLSDLIPLSDNPSDANYSKAMNFIKGHILFFKNNDNTGRFITDETQTLTFSSTENKEVPLHWVWPDTLGNMVLTSESVTNVCTGAEKTALITYIQNNPSLFFDLGDLDSDMLENNKLKAIVLGTDLSDTYPTLNLAYNNSDQAIGIGVQYIMIELVIDGKLVDAE